MGSWSTSWGERVTTEQRNRRITIAKKQKQDQVLEEKGFEFCEDCGRNASNTRIDKSHDISVKECSESGRVELSWDVDNITNRCSECHLKHDNNGIRNGKL